MTDDVNIPPLPESQLAWINGRAVAWFTGDQMRAFYLQGYNDGRNAPRVLGAGLDPWPNSGDPVIADALRAPDDDSFIKGLRVDASGNVGIGEPDAPPIAMPDRVDTRMALQALATYFHRLSDLWEGPDGVGTDGTQLCEEIGRKLIRLARMPMALGLTKIPPFPEMKP